MISSNLFAGIFLETELSTSSRMFEFVFKMFAQGDVAIPESEFKRFLIKFQRN